MQDFQKHSIVPEALDAYAEIYTTAEPLLLQELIEKSHEISKAAYKISGRQVGRLLKFLVQISQAKYILDLGTFTGYSALSLAEGITGEGKVITCDTNAKSLAIAYEFCQKSPYGHLVEIKEQLAEQVLQEITSSLDFIFIDADKGNYKFYFEKSLSLLKKGGIIVLDNMLWQGKVLTPEKKSDHIIHELNQVIMQDPNIENILLTVRDGIQIIRKK